MRRIRKKLDHWTARLLDIPQDVTMDVPRLTLLGKSHLHIENHRGVLHFSGERLLLALSTGELEIQGNDLSIRTIMAEEVIVEGSISQLKYI